MNIYAMSVGFVIYPVTFIDIPIDVCEFPKALSSVVFPISFVACPIWPDLLAVAISETADPLAGIGGSGLISVRGPLLSCGIWVVFRIVRNGLT